MEVFRGRGIRLSRRLYQSVSLLSTNTNNAQSSPSSSDQNAPQERKKFERMKQLNINPGISQKPIASPAVARFKRMSMSDEARELLEIFEGENRSQQTFEFFGRITTEVVIDVLDHLTNVDASEEFFRWCNSRDGFTHNTFTFNRFMEFLVNKGRWRRAHQLLLTENFQPNSFTYATLLRGCCEEGDTKQAFALLEHMKQAKIAPKPRLYNILLTHLCKAGREKEALEILHYMNSTSCEPDEVTYNILINALCKADRLQDAQGLVDMMQEKGVPVDVVTLNTLLNGLCSKLKVRSRVGSAYKFFQDMISRGIHPNSVSYTIVINSLLRVGFYSDAQELLDQMHRTGCSFDIITYNMLINRFAKAKLMEKAEALFAEMPSRGCAPDVVTYNSMIEGFCRVDRVDRANELFREMAGKGVNPNVRTYMSVTLACFKTGRLQEARDYLLEMRKKDLVDEISYRAIIRSVCHMGKGKLAFYLLKEMIEKRFQPDLDTYNVVFSTLVKEGGDEEVGKLIAEMKQFGASGKVAGAVPGPKAE